MGISAPLQRAADKGSLNEVKILLPRGADPLIKDAGGLFAVEGAEYNEHDS